MNRLSPLRQAASLLETQGPGEGYQLVHLRPSEIEMLTEIIGDNGFMPGSGLKRFAGGGAVPASIQSLNDRGGQLYSQMMAEGFTPDNWTNTSRFTQLNNDLLNAISQLGAEDLDWLRANLEAQRARFNDPIYGSYAAQQYGTTQGRISELTGEPLNPPAPAPTPAPAPAPAPAPVPAVPIISNPGGGAAYGNVAPPAVYTPRVSAGNGPLSVMQANRAGSEEQLLAALKSTPAIHRAWLEQNLAAQQQRPGESAARIAAATRDRLGELDAPLAPAAPTAPTFAVRPTTPFKAFARGGKVGGLAQYAASVRGAGRGGDTQLAYVGPEAREVLKKLTARQASMNPQTGLQEFGLFSSIGKVVKGVVKAVGKIVSSPVGQVLLPIALSVVAPGIGTALGMSMSTAGSAAWTAAVVGVGTTAANKAVGASWGQALKAGAFAGLTAGAVQGARSGNWLGGVKGAAPAGASGAVSVSDLPAQQALSTPVVGPEGAASPLNQIAASSAPAANTAASTVAKAAAPAAEAAKTSLWGSLTKPFAFQETPGIAGALGRAVANPLTAGGLALMALEKPKNTVDRYDDYLERKDSDTKAMNEGYLQALASQGPYREAVAPQVDYTYGFKPESTFWRNLPKAATGGGYRKGGLAQYREFSGPVKGPGGGQDDKVYLNNARLADGEFVMDATTVADAGDGSTEEGFKVMEGLRQHIKKVKGRKHGGPIPKKLGGLNQLKRLVK